MTIRDLAAETGMDGCEIRQYIKDAISEIKKDNLRGSVRKLYDNETNGGERKYGSNRKVCPDCGTEPPFLEPTCPRCNSRERDRLAHAALMRARKQNAGFTTCDAHLLDPRYTRDCGYAAPYEVNGIMVCGVHKAKFMGRKPKVKCRAHEITDRFTPCKYNAITIWPDPQTGEDVPICGRHNASLNSGYGEKSKNEIWREKSEAIRTKQKEQLKQVDNGKAL